VGGAGDVPEGAGGTPSPSLDLSHVLSILATQPSWYSYEGSLTQPPCTEGVRWLVSPSTLPVPRTLMNQLKVMNGGENSRPLQSLGGRGVALLQPNSPGPSA